MRYLAVLLRLCLLPPGAGNLMIVMAFSMGRAHSNRAVMIVFSASLGAKRAEW